MTIPDSDVARLVVALEDIARQARRAKAILERAIAKHENEKNENPGGTDRPE
ncbi:MAG: hypothetical protein L0Z53_25440 [Acidobacteriales bacterium]|nr:hypothetical protein [Terriglobales bacterium]